MVSCNTNAKLKDIEVQKHYYDLQEIRYEKLQEALEFFSKFKVYDPKFIHRFDVNSEDYSLDGVMDMCYDSSQEFLSQALIIVPYLSEEAVDILTENGIFDDYTSKMHDIDISQLTDDANINTAVKEHMELVNSEFESSTIIIMQALAHDLTLHYTYLQP